MSLCQYDYIGPVESMRRFEVDEMIISYHLWYPLCEYRNFSVISAYLTFYVSAGHRRSQFLSPEAHVTLDSSSLISLYSAHKAPQKIKSNLKNRAKSGVSQF